MNNGNKEKPSLGVHGLGPKMVGGGEKPKNFKQTISKLNNRLNLFLPYIILALLLAIFGSIITLIGPNKIREITDLITDGLRTEIDLTAIGKIGIFLVIIYIIGALFSYIQSFIMTTITQKVSKGLRTDLSAKINKLPLKYFDNNSYGDVLSRITNDIDTISQTLNQSVSSIVTSITMLLGSLIMMLSINVVMTLSAVVAVMIGFILMFIIMSKSQKYFARQQKELGIINGHIEEIYSGLNIVKIYNGKYKAMNKFIESNEKLFDSAWKSQYMSGLMMPLMLFIGNFGYLVVCVVGAALIINNSITFGVIVAFMLYIRLFTQPLSQLAQAATSIQSAAAAGERVFEFLEEEEELKDESKKKMVLKNAKGNIEFKNVKFGYNDDKLIINDFSASIKSGQKVAIVGPTGAGKTTIVNLLMRFYEINDGDITIDGTSIKDITRENVHDLFCMVLQDTWLFEGTINENIIYNKTNVTSEQVREACILAGLDHFIKTLPQGYDTIIGDNSALSVGEKQLIMIARALVEDASFLILDEATSNVDTRTEIVIQEAMDKLMEGKTSFVIAHRLSTIKNADLILVMKEGDIIESGTHNDLLNRKGFYADLYNSQFALDNVEEIA